MNLSEFNKIPRGKILSHEELEQLIIGTDSSLENCQVEFGLSDGIFIGELFTIDNEWCVANNSIDGEYCLPSNHNVPFSNEWLYYFYLDEFLEEIKSFYIS